MYGEGPPYTPPRAMSVRSPIGLDFGSRSGRTCKRYLDVGPGEVPPVLRRMPHATAGARHARPLTAGQQVDFARVYLRLETSLTC